MVSDVASGSPVIYYVHADHLGRPVRMTAQNKARVWDVIYSPFGETSYIRTIPGTIDLRFPGQWFQLESGLAYNWHRHYDASLGRYVQPDPIGYQGGRSLFNYADANPLSYYDANGLERKPGKTPNGRWPTLPESVCGKKPKWNPDGYWEGKGRRVSWDDRSHGTGADRGNGPQGGHWDDENSGNRWDEDGNLLPGSPDLQTRNFSPRPNFAPLLPLILLLPFPGNPIYGGI
ncbi:hypothetical protein Ms3S1_p20850 (plasmid) [Methylosinus sp. 3S-1]|uniref:RHS repeat-associated core domain-containing protein n=1 Tax=Methylosinus trichosporium (strain ATCC 35070 / NCIMB 11131 / UNIQEM 75 / OB3b) TaxID=595536 RepID=A0A2D2D816_METT3|nr:RHS repeat-associated core domain-containing protein [Methylosinus trichosporium OB3b]